MNHESAVIVFGTPCYAIANVAFGTFRYAIAQPLFSELTKNIKTASKQLRRSKLMLQVKLVTPIYYVTKFQGTFVSQKNDFARR